jgi:small membrane protein
MAAMTSFQIGATLVLGIFFIVNITLAMRRRLAPRVAFSWGLLWVAAIVTILRPGITVMFAHALGIARGADLVFYLGILGMFIGFFASYVRIRRLESEITKIVREIALQRPGEPHGQ